jgi:hypothetical protein
LFGPLKNLFARQLDGAGHDRHIYKIHISNCYSGQESRNGGHGNLYLLDLSIWITGANPSDNGTEFVNKLNKEIYKLLDKKHSTTILGHPQCNAQAEVFNKTIKNIWLYLWISSNIYQHCNFFTTQAIIQPLPQLHMNFFMA